MQDKFVISVNKFQYLYDQYVRPNQGDWYFNEDTNKVFKYNDIPQDGTNYLVTASNNPKLIEEGITPLLQMEVTVTSNDFENSRYTSSRNCALARCLKKLSDEEVSVGPYDAEIGDKVYFLTYEDNKELANRCGKENQDNYTLNLYHDE